MQASALVLFGAGWGIGHVLNRTTVALVRKEMPFAASLDCPICGGPLLNWSKPASVRRFVLGRGCLNCSAWNPHAYPIIEFSTGLGLLSLFVVLGLGSMFLKNAALFCLLIILMISDLTARRAPHLVTIAGIATGFLFSIFVPVDVRPLNSIADSLQLEIPTTLMSVFGACAGALGGVFSLFLMDIMASLGSALSMQFGSTHHTSTRSHIGDALVMAMIGTFLGVPFTVTVFWLGSLLAAATGLILWARKADYLLPMATFWGLAGIGLIVTGKGDAIIDLFLNILKERFRQPASVL